MDNYGIRIDLKKFRNAGLATITGKTGKKKCVVIPVDDNREIFVGEKGIYLSLAVFAKRETGKHGETHIVKGSLPKNIREAMAEEERRAQPILGDMRPVEWKDLATEQAAPEATMESVNDDDDLPF